MRRLWLIALCSAWVLSSCTCRNPMTSPGAGYALNNGTTYKGIIEAPSNNVMFAPTSSGQTNTNGPNFGGPIMYSWGGASTTTIQASAPTPVYATGAFSATSLGFAPPTNNIWLLNGTGGYAPGIGGPNGNFGPTDYYVRWAGSKGPDPNLDYSSMTMYFFGNQIDYNLAQFGYKGFVFYARGHGNFYVALAANNTGNPYSTYNFYTQAFGPELSGDDQWHQITVQFSDMTQLYGQAADMSKVLKKCWGLQFNQEVPLQSNFQLDVDYVRFF